MGNNEVHGEGTESENNTLKSKLIKTMSPKVNEVHSDEGDTSKEEEEVANCNKDVVHANEEGNINNEGSLNGALESNLH